MELGELNSNTPRTTTYIIHPQDLAASTSKVPPPTARPGILIHGLRKQMFFSWTNRNHFLLFDTVKLKLVLIALVLVTLTPTLEKPSKPLKTQPRMSMPLFQSSSRHSRGSLEDHSIWQENHMGFAFHSLRILNV